MGIRQWFNRAAKSASKGWIKKAKKRWAEKRDRKKQRPNELQLQREIDEAMTRAPIIERMPEAPKPTEDIDDDWFAPVPVKP
jgi:hypothetical protein